MKELKTLKDIEFFDDHDNHIAKEYNDSVKNDLKAEAVKWIYKFDEDPYYMEQENGEIMKWIMYFFNITNEELEEKEDDCDKGKEKGDDIRICGYKILEEKEE